MQHYVACLDLTGKRCLVVGAGTIADEKASGLRAAGADVAVPILWLLVSMGVWIGLGLVAGIPLVGLTWLSIGLAAASASWRG